jgi:hypothetical protein
MMNYYIKQVEESFNGSPDELPNVVPDMDDGTWRDVANDVTIITHDGHDCQVAVDLNTKEDV